MTLAKTIARHNANPVRRFTYGEQRYLEVLQAKGGNYAPSVRAAQGRKAADRRTPAEKRRDRRQRLETLGLNRRA